MVINTETQKVQRISSDEIKSILDTIKWTFAISVILYSVSIHIILFITKDFAFNNITC